MDEILLNRVYRSLGRSLRGGRISEEDAIAYVIYADAVAGNEGLLESFITIGVNDGVFLDIEIGNLSEDQERADMESVIALKRHIREHF